MSVRVRFAPSPTGPLHMGGVRTALYNYLFARKHKGSFLLRIEDTDRKRFVKGAEDYIMDSLRWCGIEWDEGPDRDGGMGPFRQSERMKIYREYANMLIGKGYAYYAFDTPEELTEMRTRLKTDKNPNPQYDIHTRVQMQNSLSLSGEEVKKRLDSGQDYVIRIRIPENEEIIVDDIIRGRVSVESRLLDDKVLFKSDGMPTYHLANVVDDHLMDITHVIRGEEWLPSAPLHVLLYRCLGWTDSMPRFAHLPLLLKPDGQGKLSKRDGDRLGFPVFPLEWKDTQSGEIIRGYRESGYFPEAFVNIIALLGWNPGTEQELFSLEELTELFSLDRVGKAGARFDPEKARWFNHQYLVRKPIKEVALLFKDFLAEKGISQPEERLGRICSLVRDRVSFVHELWEESYFFFQAPSSYDEKFARKKWKDDTPALMTALAEKLAKTGTLETESIENAMNEIMQESGAGAGRIMPPLRLALVGAAHGPDVKEIMKILGRDETVERIKRAIESISSGRTE